MPKLKQGFIDDTYPISWYGYTDTVKDAWDLLRAQEHVAIAFLLDHTVNFGEAWFMDMHKVVERWRVHPATIAHWEACYDIDWRPTETIPEDFYAA